MSPTRNARLGPLSLESSRLCNVFGLCCTLGKTASRVKDEATFPTSEPLDEFPQRPGRDGGNSSCTNPGGGGRNAPRPAGQARPCRAGRLRTRGPLLAQGGGELS